MTIMDTLTFLAEIVKALAWPIVTLCLLIVLREPLKELVPLLRKLKYGDFEAEFGQRLDEIEKLNAEVTAVVEEEVLFEGEVPPAPGIHFAKIPPRALAFELAKVNPRSAILEAWLNVELAAQRAVQRLNLAKPGTLSPVQTIRVLDRAKLLDVVQMATFQDLRALRNEAAHSPEMALSPDMALRYADLAEGLARSLDAIKRRPAH